eukprot:TRINITY_DN1245_c0_g2_i2.p1 TRINITY_DN1245_c0_g2~~TRINITY_DN1245_c0_g2_i2.p1  ORF type:complete len:739 (-),score=196.15 TRINITY_DN1245_c0_g2_i2:213-2429(-)
MKKSILFLFFSLVISFVFASTCPPLQPSQQTNYWLEDKSFSNGLSAWNPGFQVFRNVKDFGAKGDGVSDDTAAIRSAISAGNRCGLGCDSSTLSPAIIYFPKGTYIVSDIIVMNYFTQLVGDALNLPVLKASASKSAGWLLESDPYAAGGASWWTNQNNFFRQIRNFVIDLTQVPPNVNVVAIHWQVAQATSISNVFIKLSKAPGNMHQGIWMENGSGGFMSDITIEGGRFGMWVGNQQFTSRNIKISGADTAIFLNWDWGWTFTGITIENCRIGFDHSVSDPSKIQAGSAVIIDSTISNTKIFVMTSTSSNSKPPTAGTLLLSNIQLNGVDVAIKNPSGATILPGGTKKIYNWGQGKRYMTNSSPGEFSQGELPQVKRSGSLLSQGNFFGRPRPTYKNYGKKDIINVKDLGAKGDGNTDDTAVLNKILRENAGCKIIFFPAGSYILTDTLFVPPGSRITGYLWSILMAKGSNFADMNNPRPVVKVGNAGDSGIVELSDLLFSTSGPLPGAVLVQWNIRESSQGSVGMWDCHFRVGGAKGTQLGEQQCTKGNGPSSQCMGVFMLLHLTSTSSAYLENVWAWTADHDLDGNHAQISIYTGRGILIESRQGPVWMYGTASEHNVMYQYALVNAQNVFMGMIQTETPYYQPFPKAPAPYVENPKYSDPSFSNCNSGSNTCAMAWGLRIVNSTSVYLYGAGLYNFFSNYNQACLDSENCQENMVQVWSIFFLFCLTLTLRPD